MRYVLVLILGLFFWNCKGNTASNKQGKSADAAKIEFKSKSHDFGTINEGDTVSTVYEFRNLGTMPLEILNVAVTCGCTVAEKPTKLIGTGQWGKIKVKFNSTGKEGVNKKFVTIQSNASNSSEVVSFDVIVIKK